MVASGAVHARAGEGGATRLVLDSSARPQPDALTNSEAFLAGISSCGVTLIEGHARESGISLRRIDVTIEGVRPASDPARFASVTMTFDLAGVSQQQAESLVETYRRR